MKNRVNYISLLIILLLLLTKNAFAAGVPVLQYSTQLSVPLGDPFCSNTNYDWKNDVGSTSYYYKVIGYSPDLSTQNYFYFGNLINFSAALGDHNITPWSKWLTIQGNNGSGWFDMANVSFSGYAGSFNFNTPVSQYRVVLGFTYAKGSSQTVGTFLRTYDKGSLNVWAFGADQSTADQARQYAAWANQNATNAANNSWYNGTYGGTSESVGNIAGYIRNTQLPGIETKITNLQTAVTNIQNADTMPPTVDIQTVSGARATSTSSIQAIVTVTDNRPGPYTYSINSGSYSTLPSDGRISIPVSSPGNNSITVSVKDVAGNTGSKTIVIRKL